MILYLDTSSLVQLYVEEEGAPQVRGLLEQANTVATSTIAYAEARAAFARKRRDASLTEEELRSLLDDFERDWERYLCVEVSGAVVRLAGDLAEKHCLRGFDAIHLASALTLKAGAAAPVTFSCADRRLQQAAGDEGLDAA